MDTSKIASAMTTISIEGDADETDLDLVLVRYVSKELTASQTVTGSQSYRLQIRAAEDVATANLFVAISLQVVASDASTVRKNMIDGSTPAAPVRDGTEVVTTLTNRALTGTTAATNYTTVAGDRFVLNLGLAGDPTTGSGQGHDGDLRIGDAAATDLASDDTDTDDDNPWFQLTDTLTFVSASAKRLALLGVG